MNINELLVDFRITSRCNAGCSLCFRNPNIKDQTLNNIKNVISKMFALGFRRIGFTGGEPTIRDDYLDMIRFAKNLGFLTYLSTIGHKFVRHLEFLDDVLDWVGLPIDGISVDTNTKIRSIFMGNQHEVIKDIFGVLSTHHTKVKIKLTTVVSNANLDELEQMVCFVNAFQYKFSVWRFYQFCPLGLGKEKREDLEIPTTDFLNRMTNLKSKFNDARVSWATFEDRDMANVVMEPNFDVIIPKGEGYTKLCNMQKDSDDLIISSIMGDKEVIAKCEANRFWVK